MVYNETLRLYTLSQDEYEALKISTYSQDEIEVLYKGIPIYVNILLLVIGVVLNSTSVVVFSRPQMKSVFNFLLALLEGINIVLYLTMIPGITAYCFPILIVDYYFVLVHYINQCVVIGVSCVSNWLTVTISVFRFIAVTWPLASMTLCTKRRAYYCLIGISVVATLMFATGLSLCTVSLTTVNIEVNATLIRQYELYTFGFNFNMISERAATTLFGWLHLLAYTVPCLVTVLVTVSLLFNLWRARIRRKSLVHKSTTSVNNVSNSTVTRSRTTEKRVTLTLLLVIALQIVAHGPTSVAYAILVIYSDARAVPTFLMELESSKFLVLVSNFLTFFVYLIMSNKFRQTLLRRNGSAKTLDTSSKESNLTIYGSSLTVTSHM